LFTVNIWTVTNQGSQKEQSYN